MQPFSTPTEQENAIRRAAKRAGGRVLAMQPRETSAGVYMAARVDFRDPWGAARFLVALTAEDAETPGARDLALSLGAGAPGFVEAAFRYVQDNVRFVREAGEVFAMGSYTLAVGAGDCDDQARLLCAILLAGGVRARLVFLERDRAAGPVHVVTQAHDGGAWVWLETTIAARMGEAPYAAAQRLGLVKARADIARDAVILDERTLRPSTVKGIAIAGLVSMAALAPGARYTGDLPSAYFYGLEQMAARFRGLGADVTGEDLAAVFNGESSNRASAKNPAGAYGLNQIVGDEGLRRVGWTAGPAAYLALPADRQLPYVEAYFIKTIPPTAWPRIKGARGLYVANGWPGALQRGVDPRDDFAVFGSKAGGGYYPEFDFSHTGVNRSSDVDRWIALRQQQEGQRWIEVRTRLANEGDEPAPPSPYVLPPPAGPHWILIGAIAAASAAVAWAVHRA